MGKRIGLMVTASTSSASTQQAIAIEQAVTPERKKEAIAAFFDEEVRYQLHGIAHHNRTTILMEGWLGEVFANFGRRRPEAKR